MQTFMSISFIQPNCFIMKRFAYQLYKVLMSMIFIWTVSRCYMAFCGYRSTQLNTVNPTYLLKWQNNDPIKANHDFLWAELFFWHSI